MSAHVVAMPQPAGEPRRPLTDPEHVALASYLAREAGLVFDSSRRGALTAVVADRLEASGLTDLRTYLSFVTSAEGAEERQRLIDAVTVPETHFFRNPPQMAALRRRLLPELIRRATARRRPLTIWSAGCSTGEEPYSLAMLALSAAESVDEDVSIRVLATDLSSQAVVATKRARYSGRSLGLVTPDALGRWFTPDGSAYVVKPEVRSLVEARLHNLVKDALPFGADEVDLLVCRNVTIYFSRETTRTLVNDFHRVLTPGGYLLLGHAETLWQVTDAFSLVSMNDAFAYHKSLSCTKQASKAEQRTAPTETASPIEPPITKAIGRRLIRRNPSLALVSDVVPPPPLSNGSPLTAETDSGAPGADESGGEVVTPFVSGAELLNEARDALLNGRYLEAAELASRASEDLPFEVDAYVIEGRARATIGDDRGALIALRKAVYLAPDAGHARFLLAAALMAVHEFAASAREYRAAAAALPKTSTGELADLLDGCSVGELVAHCLRTADAAARMNDLEEAR